MNNIWSNTDTEMLEIAIKKKIIYKEKKGLEEKNLQGADSKKNIFILSGTDKKYELCQTKCKCKM